MGQLKDRRIIQSRIWLDPNPSPIPNLDYDYSYPITVYEAIKKDMDDSAPTLKDELDSIYLLISQKQEIVEPGIPGSIMTWTGVRGSIGSVEIAKSMYADTSHQRVLSERAIETLLNSKVAASAFSTHENNNAIHVTDIERNRWNSMAPMSTLHAHIGNVAVHITEEERGRWNNKGDLAYIDGHVLNLNNPHNVDAHQVGTYTRREIDDMFVNQKDSFFHYMNIYWDDRNNKAELTEYHPNEWNPNYILSFDEALPAVPNDDAIYFALKPLTDFNVDESQDCLIYIKRPGMVWSEVGLQTMSVGDMVIKFPETIMYTWIQGRWMKLFNNGAGAGTGTGTGTGITSDLMWRPVIDVDTGELTWVRSIDNTPPAPFIVKGDDGYTPIKGVDYNDGTDGAGVPIGGRSSEILVKASDDNFDSTWKTLDELLDDLVVGGTGLPDNLIAWDQIRNRPEWYNELGDNDNGFITQRAATRQFEIVNNSLTDIRAKLEGPGSLDEVKADMFDHMNDFTNPHRITPAQIGAVAVATFTDHSQDFNNPHAVTPAQLGMGNVENTADMDKPISNATQQALDQLRASITTIINGVDGNNFINEVEWDPNTTALTFIFKDTTEQTITLPISDIFQTMYFDRVTGELVIVLPNGAENRIDIKTIITNYTGSVGTNVQVEITDTNQIQASIIGESITEAELQNSINLPGSPTTKTQAVSDRSTHIATTEFVRNQVIDNLISYETDRALSANMGRILNETKVDVADIIELIDDMESIEVIDNLESTNALAALSANMGRHLDLVKAPRTHTSPSGATFGRATIALFGHARASDIDPLMDGTVFRGTDDGYFARGDHRHPTDETRAPIHWPDVTHGQVEMTGEPRAVSAPDDSNDNRIATTSWIRRNAVGVQYGDCNTAGVNATKIATLRSDFMDPAVFMRQTGSAVVITFNEDDASTTAAKLDVQNTGAADIIFDGKPIINGMINGGCTYVFSFDGINWRLLNPSGIHVLPDDDNSNAFVSSSWVRRNLVGVAKGASTTAGNNPNKTATLRSDFMDPVVFMRQTGTTVVIRFSNEDRSGATPTTLNVENSGAATIIFAGAPVTTGMLGKNHDHMFTFDGTNWALINPVPGTGIGGPDGITIGPGRPVNPDDPDTEDEIVINKMTGHNGTIVNATGDVDAHGQVLTAWITVNYTPKAGAVEVELSTTPNAWAVRMGDGTFVGASNPVVIEAGQTNAIVQFTLANRYPTNSPCQLVYRTNKAWINIKEVG